MIKSGTVSSAFVFGFYKLFLKREIVKNSLHLLMHDYQSSSSILTKDSQNIMCYQFYVVS